MKNMKPFITAVIAVAFVIAPAFADTTCSTLCPTSCKTQNTANPYLLMGGPGIVTSESATGDQLPPAAQDFLRTYYSRVMVGPINRNIIKDQYNVTLGNGVTVTFNQKGRVESINSNSDDPLYAPAIKAVLPEKAYKHLEDAGLLYDVTGIKNAQGHGLRVELLHATPPEILFDIDGLFVILDD